MPYATHPVEVMLALARAAEVPEEWLAAALLHDTLELTPLTSAEIAREFGPEVARLVRELTREEPDPTGMTKAELVEIRSELLLAGIARMSEPAMAIKLADRWVNLQEALRTRRGRRRERYLQQTEAMLELIPRPMQPALWDAIQALLEAEKARLRRK
jgi:GTP pyrophosphokinase